MNLLRRCVGAFVFCSLLGGTPLWAETTMPARAVEIIHALYAGVSPQDDDARRIAITRTCEQLSLELGPWWGGKKRTGLSDEFRSPDSLAYREQDGSVSVWDIQTSSGQITVSAGKPPDYPRLPSSEAAFMPCHPTNHLVSAPTPGPPAPTPGPPPVINIPAVDLSGLESKLDALARDLAAHEAKEAEFRAQAKGIWEHYFKPFLSFTTKYVMPAVVAFLAGREMQQ